MNGIDVLNYLEENLRAKPIGFMKALGGLIQKDVRGLMDRPYSQADLSAPGQTRKTRLPGNIQFNIRNKPTTVGPYMGALGKIASDIGVSTGMTPSFSSIGKAVNDNSRSKYKFNTIGQFKMPDKYGYKSQFNQREFTRNLLNVSTGAVKYGADLLSRAKDVSDRSKQVIPTKPVSPGIKGPIFPKQRFTPNWPQPQTPYYHDWKGTSTGYARTNPQDFPTSNSTGTSIIKRVQNLITGWKKLSGKSPPSSNSNPKRLPP